MLEDKSKGIRIYFFLSFVESLLAFIWLLLIPGESGFSISRLGMLGFLAFFAISFLILIIKSRTYRYWSETILQKLIELPARFWWGLVLNISLGLLISAFILLQWFYISTDEYLSSYLVRLNPLLVFGVIFCAQTLLYGFFCARLRDTSQGFLLTVFGFVSALPGLFVIEYFWADQKFPQYFVFERYASAYDFIMPIALFISALYAQVLFYYLRARLKFRLSGMWFAAITLTIIGILFYNSAIHHARKVNTDPSHSDQQVYINLAKKVHRSGFSYTGERNQTPLYPFIQAIFYQPEMDDMEFFATGKQVNIVLSLVLLLGLFFVFRLYFSLHQSVNLTLVAAFSLFIFKSPYFAVENLYYFLSFLAYFGMTLMLISPSIRKGILTGLALGLAYYAKASVLPALALFCVIFLFKEIWRIAFLKHGWNSSTRNWISFGMLILAFLGVLFPYIQESKNRYGQYFYNQNSTFFIWYDDFFAARTDSDLYGYGHGWPDLPQDEIPSLSKYLREHTLMDIVDRFAYGFGVQLHYASNTYNGIHFPMIYLIIIILVGIQNVGFVWGKIVDYKFLLAFVLLFLMAYITLFSWYEPIAGGPRFLYGLFVPFAYSIYVVRKEFEKEIDLSLKLISTNTFYKSIDIIIFSLLIGNYYVVLTRLMPSGYFGS